MIPPYGDDPKWETADGERIPVSKLTNFHLKNIIAVLERRIQKLDEGESGNPSDWILQRIVEIEDWLDVLEEEKDGRGTGFSW